MYQDDRSTCRAIVIIITPFVFFKMSLTCRDNFFVVKNVMTFKTCPLVRIGPYSAMIERLVDIIIVAATDKNLYYHMTRTDPRAISLENHKKKSPV